MLYEVVRLTYNQGKDKYDPETLRRVVSWGSIAEAMRMDSATLEEILSTVVRAQIRLHDYSEADKTIIKMKAKRFRSVTFLTGHSLRRQGRTDAAIPFLREAVRQGKGLRSAVHELALCYKREGNFDELKELLDDHAHIVSDSAFFLDFQIGLDVSAGRFSEAESKIERLGRLSDDNGRSGYRAAQLLERRLHHKEAKHACT
jgi:tetratricopeptide (TPR) repeat protein